MIIRAVCANNVHELFKRGFDRMIPDKVMKILKEHGLEVLEFERGSTPTAEMAAKRIGVSVGQIAKSILMKGKNEKFFMFVVEGDAKISSSKAKAIVGTKVRMATAEESLNVTGFAPGGICPFGIEGVELFIDKGLSKYPVIYPAAGTDFSGVPISFEKLKSITGAMVCDVIKD